MQHELFVDGEVALFCGGRTFDVDDYVDPVAFDAEVCGVGVLSECLTCVWALGGDELELWLQF